MMIMIDMHYPNHTPVLIVCEGDNVDRATRWLRQSESNGPFKQSTSPTTHQRHAVSRLPVDCIVGVRSRGHGLLRRTGSRLMQPS
jgi:hypothetical protein